MDVIKTTVTLVTLSLFAVLSSFSPFFFFSLKSNKMKFEERFFQIFATSTISFNSFQATDFVV